MNETTNKNDNPILICIGSYKDFYGDSELFCGGCGYQYSPDEAEDMFKEVKLKIANTGGIEVHAKPLHCVQCCRRYESVYFDELGEVSKIVPLSLFKNRYVTHYGELILPEEHGYAELVPYLDPSRRIKMAYTDSIAYMLYSSGIRADKLKMLIDRYECILYNGGTIIDASLYEDINRVPRNAICHYANQFDKIVTAMDEMKNGDFVFMSGD